MGAGIGMDVLAELFVVYDADGTVVGEAIYSLRKWFGGHCSACDITHGLHYEKPEFSDFKSGFEVPVTNIHRDEMDVGLRRCAAGRLPCVIARLESGEYTFLLEDTALMACGGSVLKLKRLVDEKLRKYQIAVPDANRQELYGDQAVPTARNPQSSFVM